MYRKTQDFIHVWKYETECTLKYISTLKDEMIDAKPNDRVRSAGFLTWHLIHTTSEMMNRTGLNVTGGEPQDYAGQSVATLHQEFSAIAESLAAEITAKWTDADLEIEDEMYGEKWQRGATLNILITHLAHHRGQLSVIMRMAGLIVPGVYGPSYEEWMQWGREPMK